MSLKEKLLSLNIVVDNEYLDKYVELIENNRETKREKFKTQKHHIIPKYYYRLNKIDVDNSKNNLVNLLYKDHILAHYYLCLCSPDNNLVYQNFLSMRYVLGYTWCNENDILKSLDKYQELYELSRKIQSEKETDRKLKPCSESRKKKIGNANRNKKCMYKDNISKMIQQSEVEKYLEEGWKLGNPRLSKVKAGKPAWNKGLPSPLRGIKRPVSVGIKVSQNTPNKKKIYCFELNKIFESGSEASKQLNISQTMISLSCRNFKKNKSRHVVCKKYSFKFFESEDDYE